MRGILRIPAAAAVFVSFAAGLNAVEWSALGRTQVMDTGITPGVAIDGRGTIHVVYMRGAEILHGMSDARGPAGAPGQVPAPPGAGEYNSPHLVCDADGTVHLVFTRGFTRNAKVAWYSNRRAGRWSRPVVAIEQTETNRRVNYPRVAVDGTTAYVGAFAAAGSTVAKLVDLASTPRVAGSVDTRLWVAHPVLRGGEVVLVGRAGAQGHMLERYSRELEPLGAALLLSGGTPGKTGEPTAAFMDRSGIIHAVGVTGGAPDVLWYNNDRRAAPGLDAALGPELGDHVDEYTYPVLQADERGRLYLAFRHHTTGEGRITVIDPETGRFAEPVTFAPAITRRLRWNAPLAAAPGGGVYAVWEADGTVHMRAIGVPGVN